jgi:hypothetical protein
VNCKSPLPEGVDAVPVAEEKNQTNRGKACEATDNSSLLPTPTSSSSSSKRKFSAVDLASTTPDSGSDRKLFRSVSSISTKLGLKVTANTALSGVSSSIDHLTLAFEKSLVPQEIVIVDPIARRRTEAVKTLSNNNDAPNAANKVKLISLFAKDPTVADVYLAIEDEDVRQAWLESLLAPPSV